MPHKYFKNTAETEIYAYPWDGSQDDFILHDLIPISAAEADEIRSPFAQRQIAKKSEVERMRDVAVTADVSVTIHGVEYTFQADSRSQALVQGALLSVVAGISPAPTTWRSSNNTDVTITIDDLRAIGVAMVSQTQAAYSRSWTLKKQVGSAKNQADLDAIKW